MSGITSSFMNDDGEQFVVRFSDRILEQTEENINVQTREFSSFLLHKILLNRFQKEIQNVTFSFVDFPF